MRLTAELGRRRGREAGYKQGYKDGYKLGFSNVITQRPIPVIKDAKILYITAGIGAPYPALDQSIIDGLSQLVSDVKVASPSDDITAIVSEQATDLVLVLNGVAMPTDKVDELRNNGYRTAVWFTDDPYYTDWTAAIAPHYDYVFTLELGCVQFYQELGCQHVFYLPFAANTNMFLPKQVDSTYNSDICFIGTAFWNRVRLVDRLAPLLFDKKFVIAGWWWDRLYHYHNLSGSIKGDWLSPEETASYYNGAKIVINLHRSIDDDSINVNSSRKISALSVNPRTFEIAGCGAFQLTDLRQETGQIYAIDSEIAIFTTFEELVHKIHYYLANEEEREAVAIAALARTKRDHTYQERLITMLTSIFP